MNSKNANTTLIEEALGYLKAESVLRPLATPGNRVAVAARLLRALPAQGTAYHRAYRLRLEDELLISTPVDPARECDR